MYNSRLFMLCTGLLICITFGNAYGGDVPFSSTGIASLLGKDICNLQGDFPKQFGLYLDRKEKHAIHYRERDGVIALFLLDTSQPPKKCGIVDAILDLTPLINKGEVPYFKCHINRVGRTKWGHVVGLADNQEGRKRFVKARLAWKVNTKEKRFEEIKGQTVSCDTSGYIYGDGWY